MNLSNYKQELFKPNSKGYFLLPWGSIVVRNLNKKGELIEYDSFKKLKEKSNPMWIELPLFIFRNTDDHYAFFPLFRCSSCKKMSSVDKFPLDQRGSQLQNVKCLHSQIADEIILRRGDTWQQIWNIDLDDIAGNDLNYKVKIHNHVDFIKLCSDKFFLAAVYRRDLERTSILFTLNNHTKTPYCSVCSKKPCKCFRLYERYAEQENPDEEHYWQRQGKRQRKAPTQYDAEMDESEHFSYFGFNLQQIQFPFNDEIKAKFQAKHIDLPESFTAEADRQTECKNGFKYDPHYCFKIRDDITVYEESVELTISKAVYGRRCLGNCKVSFNSFSLILLTILDCKKIT